MILPLVLIASAAFIPRDNPTDKKPVEAPKILGNWQLTKALGNGQEMPADRVGRTKLEFSEGKVVVQDGERKEEATYTLDATKKPMQIDIKPVRDGAEKVQGILKLDGDVLTICFKKGGGDRPTEFESKEGSGHSLMILKRAK